jgi:CHAD domain-containing protein
MPSPAPKFSPHQAGELLDHLASQIRLTIKRPDERHVHDLRVAIRRFGQALAIFKSCIVAGSWKEIRKALKQIMEPAGEIRNCDITVKLLEKIDHRSPAALNKIRKAAEKVLLERLRLWADQPAAWHTHIKPCRHLSPTATRKLIREGTARAAERVHQRAGNIGKSIVALHKLRIAMKKLRYTLELAGATTDPIKDIQTQLGDINDYRAARQLLKRIDGTADARHTLAKKQRKKVRRFRHEFKEPAAIR